MANWANLIARLVTRIALSRTVRTLFRTVKPKKKRARNNNRNKGKRNVSQQAIEQAPPINYYKIGFLILLLLVLGTVFYLIVEKRIPFLQ